MPLSRSRHVRELTIADGAAISDAFDFSQFSGGLVLVPSGWIDANLGLQVSPTQTGTYTVLLDDQGVAVQVDGIVVGTAYWYKLPDDLFGAAWVKLWSKNTAPATLTDTNQTGGPLSFTLLLKG